MKSIYEFLLNEHLLKNKTVSSTQGMGYVDLGLPSGLLWATCNIGAKEPADHGDYFMWGSTGPDTDKPCDWKHSPFNDGNITYNGKSFMEMQDKACPNGILVPEYDAATVILGDDWRMPTYDDFNELLNNTTNAWVENYEGSGINGRLFTSRTDDSKTLFIPASGFCSGSSCLCRGIYAYLWSSSISTGRPNCARFLYGNASSCSMNDSNRCYGLCLRGVTK